MKRNILIIVTIILVGFLAVLLWMNDKQEKAQAEYYRQRSEQAAPYESEKQELESQLSQLEREYRNQQNGMGTLEILFPAPTAELIQKVKPQMEAQGMAGILALSESGLPGTDGSLTVDEIHALIEDGWQCCLFYDDDPLGADEIGSWVSAIKGKLDELNLSVPTAVYFAPGTYDAAYDTALQAAGMDTVIHHGENGSAIITRSTEEGIWHIGSCGWNSSGVSDQLNSAAAQGGNLVFSVGGEGEEERYEESQFTAMLEKISAYAEQEQLMVTDFNTAEAYWEKVSSGAAEIVAEYEEETARIQTQIDELRDKIREIYNQTRQQ